MWLWLGLVLHFSIDSHFSTFNPILIIFILERWTTHLHIHTFFERFVFIILSFSFKKLKLEVKSGDNYLEMKYRPHDSIFLFTSIILDY